ncbi:NAD(P)-dependent dehydrogenase, short-chain alcohol dehydrogenase family [Amycolatopsis xylanica]|uniref:NAD(P)-dependent dehydrogenase, short-chain alcohol dehydrogenase family n=1 Tax=Amycolatopsis xylanica TaxID=589385 RepID=A0A1H3GSN8_9PSEU|nr:NAD(P)-dependent dehydrogenase, short-chain alcohol dehydrogenase family [Amycolatopsis xylanica]
MIVLGGTSGIGLATAIAAAGRGAEVTVVSSRQSSVDKALAALPGATGRVTDLGDPASVRALFEDLGEIDHLVYTAGEPLELMPMASLDLDAARDFFSIRYFGVLSAVRSARVRESITLTTGVAKDRPGPGWAVAASICGAMESLTKALAVELAPVRVNAVSPGVVRSPLWSRLSDDDREQLYRATAAQLPAGRVGEVEDVAEAFLFCMTQAFATGTVVTVDGGTVLV